MVWAAKSEGRISVSASALDADDYLVNFANGTLDLQRLVFRRHRRSDLLTKQIPYAFDAAAECPTSLRFLNDIMRGDTEKIEFLQRWFGYCLSGDVREQCFVVLWGDGSNGKSTLVD
jgi:putative DNA primase/helicase